MGTKSSKPRRSRMNSGMIEASMKAAKAAAQEAEEYSCPELEDSGKTRMKPGDGASRRAEHKRKVTMVADPAMEHTYAVAPHEVVIDHAAGELLGGTFLQVSAKDLPGMPALPGSDDGSMIIFEDGSMRSDDTGGAQQLAILSSILPGGPVARHNELHDHSEAIFVGSVILSAKKLSETSTSFVIGRWGWSVVVEPEPGFEAEEGFEGKFHPGATVERHSSFARISYIQAGGSICWTNEKHRMASVRKGDCLVSVNGVPVAGWVGAAVSTGSVHKGDKMLLNEYLQAAGKRQKWVVVRVPGTKSCFGSHHVDELIMRSLGVKVSDAGSDVSSTSVSTGLTSLPPCSNWHSLTPAASDGNSGSDAPDARDFSAEVEV